jgi:hypothetical protein
MEEGAPGLVFSSFLGFGAGLCLILLIYWLFRNAVLSRVSGLFRWLQICSSAFMAFSHGSNDGQKFIGAFTLALVLGGGLPAFDIPAWVILLCAAVMALGTSIGGWRTIRTLGGRVSRTEASPRVRCGDSSRWYDYPSFWIRYPAQHDPYDHDIDHGSRSCSPNPRSALECE